MTVHIRADLFMVPGSRGVHVRIFSTQFDAVRGSFVCSMEDEDDMVTDYRFAMLPVFR